jgi:hypothetical protein
MNTKMRSLSRVLPILLLSVLAAACGKAPAEQALKAADAALEAARPEVEKYVPAEWQALSGAAAAAKSQLEQGNYKEALVSAQGLVPKIQTAVTAAQDKKKGLMTGFEAMKGSLPGMLDVVSKQLAAYAAMKKLPAGIDKGAVAAAQAELPSLTQNWASALTAFDGGDMIKAVDTAFQVKAKVEELSKTFLPTATAATPATK